MRQTAGCLALAILAWSGPGWTQSKQEHVHRHSGDVMQFDMASTIHVFRMNETGGVQRVVLRSGRGDAHDIALIQQHLMREATKFQAGDFSDPTALHGATMPGLAEVRGAAAKMQIAYRSLPNGGEIVFRAGDIGAITAVHRWFGAQLSEHCDDAMAE